MLDKVILGWLIIGGLFFGAEAALAGPAVDNAKAAMSAIQGSTVTDARALEMANSILVTVPPRVVDGVVVPWSTEEKAQHYLNFLKGIHLGYLNDYRDALKDVEQQASKEIMELEKKNNRLVDL